MEDKLLNEEHAAAQTAENYHRVCDEIAEAAYKAGRDPSEIRLVGATKFKTCAEILPVLKAGLAEVGEIAHRNFAINSIFHRAGRSAAFYRCAANEQGEICCRQSGAYPIC